MKNYNLISRRGRTVERNYILIWFDVLSTVALGAWLVRLVIVDLATLRLPDRLTLPLIAAGVLYHAVHKSGVPWGSLIGAAVGYGVFAALGAVYFRWRRVDGLGLGDAKLLAAAGAWLGIALLPWLVLAAASAALVHAWWTGAGRRRAIAFGPWLAGAFWLLWVFTLARGIAEA